VKVTVQDIMTSIAVTKFGIMNWIADNTSVVRNSTKVDLKCFILIEINSPENNREAVLNKYKGERDLSPNPPLI